MNIFAKLARSDRKVLIVDLNNDFKDLRSKHSKKNLSNLKSLLNKKNSFQTTKIEVEPNLDVIFGFENQNLEEFGHLRQLYSFDFFDDEFSELNYDYIVFNLARNLSLLNLNALSYSQEVFCSIDLENKKLDFLFQISKFVNDFNFIYEKKLFFSKIIPTFSSKIIDVKYAHLLSSYSSTIVSNPINEVKRNSEFREAIENISQSIINSEKAFDERLNIKERQKDLQNYITILQENLDY